MKSTMKDLDQHIDAMDPVLNEGVYVYAMVDSLAVALALAPAALVNESDGITVIVKEAQAEAAGLTVLFRTAWITLRVHSDLNAVGLTAAFSTVLASAGISCNVIAGANHDHLFVPINRAEEAITLLEAMQWRDQAHIH